MWKDEATDDELEEDIITQCENKAKGVWELIELPKCDIIRDDTIFAVRNGETTINLDWEQIAPVKEEKKIENKTLPLF